MAVTITNQVQLSNDIWSLTWKSDIPGALFYVYQDGILALVTTTTSSTFKVAGNGKLFIEILDDNSHVPTPVYTGVVNLSWYKVKDASSYTIEKLNGENWDFISRIIDNGSWMYSWKSDILPDCSSYSFRVVPVGSNGNRGKAVVFTGFMVRQPDTPSLSITMNGDSTLTIN